jgi:hypothetical protein
MAVKHIEKQKLKKEWRDLVECVTRTVNEDVLLLIPPAITKLVMENIDMKEIISILHDEKPIETIKTYHEIRTWLRRLLILRKLDGEFISRLLTVLHDMYPSIADELQAKIVSGEFKP